MRNKRPKRFKRQTEYQASTVDFVRARHRDNVVAGVDEVNFACHPSERLERR